MLCLVVPFTHVGAVAGGGTGGAGSDGADGAGTSGDGDGSGDGGPGNGDGAKPYPIRLIRLIRLFFFTTLIGPCVPVAMAKGASPLPLILLILSI